MDKIEIEVYVDRYMYMYRICICLCICNVYVYVDVDVDVDVDVHVYAGGEFERGYGTPPGGGLRLRPQTWLQTTPNVFRPPPSASSPKSPKKRCPFGVATFDHND